VIGGSSGVTGLPVSAISWRRFAVASACIPATALSNVPADGVSDGDESMSYRTPFAVELIYADRTRGFPLARSTAIGWILRCGLNVRAAPGSALRRGLDQPTITPLGGYPATSYQNAWGPANEGT
jgi:hypothetical protein